MKWAHERIGENILIPFTVVKDGFTQTLIGQTDALAWHASANLTLSPVNIRGEVIVTCPSNWADALSTWEANGINPIVDWQLYDCNTRVEGHNLSGIYS